MNCCIIEYAALGPSKQHQNANSTISGAGKRFTSLSLNTRSTFAIEWQQQQQQQKNTQWQTKSVLYIICGVFWFSNRSSGQHIYSVHIFWAGQMHDISRQVELYATLLFILFLLVFHCFFFFFFFYSFCFRFVAWAPISKPFRPANKNDR